MTGADSLDQLVALFERTHETLRRHAARSVDGALVARNWLYGWYIEEFERGGATRAEVYGKGVMKDLAERLAARGLKGCSVRSLFKFRRFYLDHPEIRSTVSALSPGMGILPTVSALSPGMGILPTVSALSPTGQELVRKADPSDIGTLDVASFTGLQLASLLHAFPLGWSHYLELMQIDNVAERRFYEIEAIGNQWSVRELRRQIDSSLYERLALSRDKTEVRRLAAEGQVVERAADLIKNPLVLEFLGLEERPHYTEDDLESAIIDRLQAFLLELGKGFLFEARQKRFTFDNDHYRIDLVFYNRLLRCYVLLDLKRGRLTHQDLGQMQMYVNYYDRHVRLEDELPTVGIVLCHDKNDALVELTLPEGVNIFASKYQLYLPSKEELKTRLEEITRSLEGSDGEW
jgi:predicted nuclease of restriction endonuclease-like (RecB) superfamily